MTVESFRPSHVVPRDGLPAWETPDVYRPTEPLDPLLPVQLVDRRGDWSRILCANGWSAWVDGRLLVALPGDPPAAGLPLARTADPRPLLDRAAEALARYRGATDELAGPLDGEGFQQRTRGLRAGVVVDGESVWLYDAEHERWVYADGRSMSTYAVRAEPGSSVPGTGPGATGGSGSQGGSVPGSVPPGAHSAPGAYPPPGRSGASSPSGPPGGPVAPGAPDAPREPTRVVPYTPPGPSGAPPQTRAVTDPSPYEQGRPYEAGSPYEGLRPYEEGEPPQSAPPPGDAARRGDSR